jgi:uncharacterized protein YbaP (TraB family)
MLKVRMALAAAFIVVLACPALADPPLWVVKSGKAEVFLFGQMWVKADTHWQSSKTWAAFNKSVELWTENPQERGHLDPSLLAEINRNSKPVSDLLSPKDMARLQAFLQTAGVPISAVNSSNAYFLLEGVLERQGGLDPGNLPEPVFAKRAAEVGKPIHSEWGSAEAALRWGASQPDAVQAGLIRKALDELDEGAPAFNARIAAWQRGDLRMEVSSVQRFRERSPAAFRAVATDRNASWVARIKDMLSRPGVYFVCMGIDHLVGPEGVVAQLEAGGIRVKRK